MAEKDFLCALDLVDTVLLSARSTDFQIWGWIVAVNPGLKIDEVLVECGGKGRYGTSFPRSRPDVRSHYPDLENSESSGFVTAAIPLQYGTDESVEIKVIAKCNGVEYPVLAKRIRLAWFDPDNEFFFLGKLGPFKFPEEFDEGRLTSYPDCAPVFLVGKRSFTAWARRVVQAHVPHLSEGGIFLDLLTGIVECHDIYIEYKRKYFTHIESQIEGFAIGKVDIYDVLNSVIAVIHKRVMADAADVKPVYVLSGKERLILMPLIGRIYPRAQFLYRRPNAIVRAGDAIVASYIALSRRHFSASRKYRPYENALATRSFDRLLRILTRSGKYDISEIDWAGGLRTERLLSRLGNAAAVPNLVGQQDRAGASHSTSSSAKVPGYLQVIPEFADATPVFVLGAGRSGTSALVGAMKTAGFEGFSEGHLFPMLNEMAQRLWERYLHSPAPPPGLGGLRVRVLDAVVSTAFESAYGEYGQRVWLDKTPDHPMIECIPFLRALFPRARFLMMLRHPVSFAESRRRKFGEPVLSAVSEWARCVKSWKPNKSSLPASQYLEVDLNELTNSSLQQALLSFLELDAEQRKSFTDYLASERPEFTRVPPELLNALEGLDDERRYNLRSIFFAMLNSLGEYAESAGWDGETTKQVVEVLRTLPEEYGYKIRAPDGHLESLLLQWARELEEYRYTAEYHEKNAAYWAEQAKNWRIAAECGEGR